MSKINIQKLKLLYLQKIFTEKTAQENPLSVKEIKALLEDAEIQVTEQTLRDDIECLRYTGMDIITAGSGKNTRYYLGENGFSLAELKIICDSIQSSRSISEKRSRELIGKIEGLTNEIDRRSLNRQIYLSGRPKTINEKIWYNIDSIYHAIDQDYPIHFDYMKWDLDKKLVKKNADNLYEASPWSLISDGDSYYMVAYDHRSKMIRHYRVDKMQHLSVIENEKRRGLQAVHTDDIADYSKRHFGMFGGVEKTVTIRCENELVNVIIDRFGEEVNMQRVGEHHFDVVVDVVISEVFFGWLFGLGNHVRIIEPPDVIEKIRESIDTLSKQYK